MSGFCFTDVSVVPGKEVLMSKDLCDLLFRVLFSLIFLALDTEHILSDGLIQHLMPIWMPSPGVVSILVGIVLSVGGVCIVLGWQIRFAAVLLGSFVIVVTLAVHVPALIMQTGVCHRIQHVDVGYSSTQQPGKEYVPFRCLYSPMASHSREMVPCELPEFKTSNTDE